MECNPQGFAMLQGLSLWNFTAPVAMPLEFYLQLLQLGFFSRTSLQTAPGGALGLVVSSACAGFCKATEASRCQWRLLTGVWPAGMHGLPAMVAAGRPYWEGLTGKALLPCPSLAWGHWQSWSAHPEGPPGGCWLTGQCCLLQQYKLEKGCRVRPPIPMSRLNPFVKQSNVN